MIDRLKHVRVHFASAIIASDFSLFPTSNLALIKKYIVNREMEETIIPTRVVTGVDCSMRFNPAPTTRPAVSR